MKTFDRSEIRTGAAITDGTLNIVAICEGMLGAVHAHKAVAAIGEAMDSHTLVRSSYWNFDSLPPQDENQAGGMRLAAEADILVVSALSGSALPANVRTWIMAAMAHRTGGRRVIVEVQPVPSLSILDGWWIEGWIEGETGWAIGGLDDPGESPQDATERDAASLYEKLEETVVPLFYRERDRFIKVMRHAISLNGSFFNTQRMLSQYVIKACLT